MAGEHDYSVQDFGRCTLALRGDLDWVPQLSNEQPYYLVEDPLNARFFRLGAAEYTFVSLLDGQTTVRDAVRQTAVVLPEAAFTEQEAAVICRWLLDNGLVETGDRHVAESAEPPDDKATGSALSRWNPIAVRLPLLHPNSFFTALVPWLQWAFTPLAMLAWIMFVASGVVVVSNHWSRFVHSIDGVFAPLTWLLLPLGWLGLKLIHELAHGVACRKFGGDVREAGVILILFMPLTYVDVTSSWRMRSKWQRIMTAAAGMYAELFVAAAAAMVWGAVEPGMVSNLCCAIVVMASVTTLAFNSNFLMKFDGYYVLSDLLEIPNLSSLAQQELSHLLLSVVRLAGPVPAARPVSAFKRWFVVAYGVAALCWKVLVCACLVISASTLFDGAGIVLAVVAAVLWILAPLRKLVMSLARWREKDSDSHAYSAAMLLVVAICAALTAVPWPGANHTPVVVEYSDLSVVRADSPGFVQEMRVRNGQAVRRGQVLAVLQNDELVDELNEARVSVKQSQIKIRAYEHDRRTAAWQAEVKQLASLQQRMQEKQSQVEQLTVRAPSKGRVIGRGLENLSGVFLEPGDTILAVGREQEKELQVAIPQEYLLRFQKSIKDRLRVKLPGTAPFYCQLVEVTPRASKWCPHEALAAVNGGSLPVLATSSQEQVEDDRWELLTPHFVGRIELPQEQSEVLRSGQVGTAAIYAGDESIGRHLFRVLRRWTVQKWRTASMQGA